MASAPSALSSGLSAQLDRQRSALTQWRSGLEKYANRQTDSLLRADADVLEEVVSSLERQQDAQLRDAPVLKAPEQRAKGLLNDLELQIFELKEAEEKRRLGAASGGKSVLGGAGKNGGMR